MITSRDIDASLDRVLSLADRWLASKAKGRVGQPTWRQLRRIVRMHEEEIASDFLKAISVVQNGTQIAAVREAYAAGNIDRAVELIPWQKLYQPEIKSQLMTGLRSVYETSADLAARLLDVPGADEFRFDIESDVAISAIEANGATLVQNLSDEGIAAMRKMLVESMNQGLSANQMQRVLLPGLALNEPQTDAVMARWALLSSQGMPAAQIQAEVAQYAEQKRLERALMIARSEGQFALERGKRDSWNTAAEANLFDRAEAKRGWLADPNSCVVCVGYSEAPPIAYDDEFPQGDPPAHPACSCTVELLV